MKKYLMLSYQNTKNNIIPGSGWLQKLRNIINYGLYWNQQNHCFNQVFQNNQPGYFQVKYLDNRFIGRW